MPRNTPSCATSHFLRRRAHNPEIHAVSAFLSRPTFRANAARHIGFLNSNRRALTLGAIAATGLLTSIPVLPASAETVYEEVEVSHLQSYVAPPSSIDPTVIRDSFGITSYTLVQWPVPSSTEMSSGFGYRDCSGCSTDHMGIDLNPGSGYPVQTVADGVVVEAEESDSGLGVHVIVQHVIDGETYETVYGHMQFGSLLVGVGQAITRGTQLGVVGSTGQSTGPHLHFEVHSGGVQVDPFSWLQAHANS